MKTQRWLIFCAAFCCAWIAEFSQAGELAQMPLFLSVIPGKPNIMLMVDTSGSMSIKVTANNDTRINIAKTAAKNLVTQLTPASGAAATVRLGLATYNSGKGGKLLFPLKDLDEDQANAIKAQITNFSAGGTTPLATTLSDIGYYFTTGNTTGNLTLHPGKSNETVKTVSEVFTKTDSSPILLGFDPATTESCTVSSKTLTPADMPVGYQSGCGGVNIVSGGATTSSGADSSNPIQMLVVSGVPTICTSQTNPVCQNQQNYGIGSELGPCPSCTDTTGTAETIKFSTSGSYSGTYYDPKIHTTSNPLSIAINGRANIKGYESPDVSKAGVTFSTVTPNSCIIYDADTTTTACDGSECSIMGATDGPCRICATFPGTNPVICNWSDGSGSCSVSGQEVCTQKKCVESKVCTCEGAACSVSTADIQVGSGGASPASSCPPCDDNTGTSEAINFSSGSYSGSYYASGTTPTIAINSRISIHATESPIDPKEDVNFSTVTADVCKVTDSPSSDKSCDDDDCSVKGLGNGICRVCASFPGTDTCSWSNDGSSCKSKEEGKEVCIKEECITKKICNCDPPQAGSACATATVDVKIGTGVSSGGGSNNGGTGGTLLTGTLCFDDTKYYRVQYNGSGDIYGPWSGAQLNWFFSQPGFTEGSLELPTDTQTTCDPSSSDKRPIQNYCQKSFAILISDGLPNGDRFVSNLLKDYTGDCGTKSLCNSTANTLQLPGVSTQLTSSGTACNKTGGTNNMICQNGTKVGRGYETNGSDYLDDVAQALYEMDLRPDLGVAEKANTNMKNNLVTYSVGFADPNLTASSVLSDAASVGGGKFFYAADAAELAAALNSVLTSIAAQVGSSASVATNSTQVGSDTMIYQAKFDSGGWFGNLNAFPIITNSSDANYGGVSDLLWDAATKIPAYSVRNILTYNPTTGAGTTFDCANLTTTQKNNLGISSCVTSDQGVWRLNYIRGDKSHELKNAKRVLNPGNSNDTETRSSSATEAIFRNRTRLDPLTNYAIPSNATYPTDPWVLGDIINSNPIYVANDDYGYSELSLEGGSYNSFRASISDRRPMIYVGANDGMLHGFDASSSTTTGGKEIVAYIPDAVYKKFINFSNSGYSHHYFVDGSPVVADAYFASGWHTVLVGTTGAGGKSIFALDVTNPGKKGDDSSGFNASSVLWEINDTTAPNNSDLTSDTPSKRGFANNLGYTLSQPSIVRLHDSSWAAVFANGYESAHNSAVLYIVNIQNGNIIRAIEAINSDESSFTTENGLSTPIPVDTDGDKIVDYIYAGDLRGNLWKFDVTDSDNTKWAVANYGKPLYIACDQDINAPCPSDHRQPITAKPEVGYGSTKSSYMVYFGTGKYFESADNNLTNSQRQSVYGIADNAVTVPSTGSKTRSNLAVQTITATTTQNGKNWRSSSSNGCSGDGWFMDLPESGERVITNPQLRGDRLIFTTLIPLPPSESDDCNKISNGTGWLMELSALCGGPISSDLPPWDVNNDGKIDSSDLINGKSPSGIQPDVGIPTMPGIVRLDPDTNPNLEQKYVTGSTGAIQNLRESFSDGSANIGRRSWNQIN